MKVTFNIEDQKTIDAIEKLRGKAPVPEFLAMCLQAGIRVVAAGMAGQGKNAKAFAFARAKDEFRALDSKAVAAAAKDAKSGAAKEISRLVGVYTRQFEDYAAANNNKMPPLRIRGVAPIEKAAIEISAKTVMDKLEKAAKKK